MAAEVKLPRLGQGMESGTIVQWLKSEGDQVAKGEPLYEVDTEKVTQEVEAEVAGVLLKIAVPQGEVAVGQTIAFIGEQGEQVPEVEAEPNKEEAAKEPEQKEEAAEEPEQKEEVAEEPEQKEEAAKESEQKEEAAEEPEQKEEAAKEPERKAAPAPVAVAPATDADGRIKASPLARRIARERGIDLAALSGTGPEGRIVAEDVERAAAGPAPTAPTAAPPPGEVESIELTSVRRTIARRLTAAWEVPVFQLELSADMSRANGLLAERKELDPDARVTVTDVLTKICAQALTRHPEVNVQFTDEALLKFPSANVALAVAAPQGLVVPVIKGAERLSLAEIAAVRADLVERSRAGKLRADDLEGGTFTISNLGMFGVERFIAVLNPPQAAILAVGATEERAVVRDGQVVVRPTMTMTLTVDHRAVDGAPAAEFLSTVKRFLEEPALAL
jgi:pyruvate dehydrogenase E2 component (dihydrolipoamide acetyltransferase)